MIMRKAEDRLRKQRKTARIMLIIKAKFPLRKQRKLQDL